MFRLNLYAFAHASPEDQSRILMILTRADLGAAMEAMSARFRARLKAEGTVQPFDDTTGGPNDPNIVITCQLCKDDDFWAGYEWLRYLYCGPFGLGCDGF